MGRCRGWEGSPDDVRHDPRAPDRCAAGHVRPPVVREEIASRSGHGLIPPFIYLPVTLLPASTESFANRYPDGRDYARR